MFISGRVTKLEKPQDGSVEEQLEAFCGFQGGDNKDLNRWGLEIKTLEAFCPAAKQTLGTALVGSKSTEYGPALPITLLYVENMTVGKADTSPCLHGAYVLWR